MSQSSLTRREAASLATLGLAAASGAPTVPDVCQLSAVEMAALIRARKLSARETLDAHLRLIERVNPKVNAIVTLVVDQARQHALEADEAQAQGKPLGPLHGLPTAHKDLQPTKGILTTFGSRILRDNIPSQDSLLVERVRHAGAIMIGKTNTPEFGAGSQTYNEVFGTTLNPWDITKTCGGSSGGTAVALACRMLPIADGSDMGGSLRNPASFCNVVGIRPSPGRVPSWPNALAWSTLSVEGPMARSVSDLASYLSALAGPDSRAPLSLGEPGERFALPLGRSFRGVRVAWWKDLGGIPMDPEVRQITNAHLRVFESLGCIVEEAEPDFSGADETFRTLRFLNTSLAQAENVKHHRDLIKDTILWEIEQASRLTAHDIGMAQLKQTELYHRMRLFMERYEFFVLPVSQMLPYDVQKRYPTEIAGTKMDTYIDWMKSCYFISAMGTPAMSVPCGFSREGLPVGIQIVARHRDDWGLLQMGYAFEQACALPKRLPSVSGPNPGPA